MGDQLPENLRKLSQAILKSLIESEDIHEILRKITRDENLNDETPLVILMELKQIKGIVQHDNAKKESGSYVEGTVLSPQEEHFIKFCDEEFDEDEWLMKLRLNF